MPELCQDLTLSIYREDDPNEKGKEQIRVRIAKDLEMMEIEVCQQINVTTQQSRRYHVLEAIVIVTRKAISEAFKQGLISDSLGEWKITRPPSSPVAQATDEIDLGEFML